jgi:hypothetical protein
MPNNHSKTARPVANVIEFIRAKIGQQSAAEFQGRRKDNNPIRRCTAVRGMLRSTAISIGSEGSIAKALSFRHEAGGDLPVGFLASDIAVSRAH